MKAARSQSWSINKQLLLGFGSMMFLMVIFGAYMLKTFNELSQKTGYNAQGVDQQILITLGFAVLMGGFLAYMLMRTIPGTVLKPIREASDHLIKTAGLLSASTQQASAAAEQNAAVAQQLAAG